ncbi:MAG: hypothetical protein WA989_18115 [Henriciella sp.]|uniref:hypothetical protein n=1 Tax=Henriciella sp. TaxID=1968823 RepID=UPI003C7153B0
MPARLLIAIFFTAAIAGTASAQSAHEASTAPERSLKPAIEEQAYIYASAPELLGGPVRQPGEIRVASERGDEADQLSYTVQKSAAGFRAHSKDEQTAGPTSQGTTRVVLTDAYRESQNASNDYIRPGTQVQTANGVPLGRVALVEKADSGRVDTAWVKQPNTNSSNLKEVDIRSVTYANGEFVAVGG